VKIGVGLKLIVQIPCYNEEETITVVIESVRDAISSFDDAKILVIDDGSNDLTVEVAQAAGADYIVCHMRNQGLANAYMTGLATALNLGADVIVNTDGDNQYCAGAIPDLVAPVINGEAEIVVGARSIEEIEHFSVLKQRLQRFGSKVVRALSGTQVRDATSGFRAISREAALRLNSFSDYTYTLETLIQAGRSGLRVASVDVAVNAPTRESRLMRSTVQYVARSTIDMLRISTIYAPLRAYLAVGMIPMIGAVFLGIRYLALITLVDPNRSHAPSLILAAVLAGLAFLIWGLGIIGEILTVNRRLLEELRVNQRRADSVNGTLHARAQNKVILSEPKVR
jgi:glycosyltransferase involved in cell wall biosynthesis